MTEPTNPDIEPFDEPAPPPETAELTRQGRPVMTRWKRVLLVLAGIMVVVGLVLLVVEDSSPKPSPDGTPSTPPGVAKSLTADGTGPAADAGEEGVTWSPLFLKLGFSFFVGFAIGYVFRTFLKIALLASGLVALSLFGLSQLDLVVVDWQKMDGLWGTLMEHVRAQVSGFKTLLTGSLPAAGSATVGLVAGFRKG